MSTTIPPTQPDRDPFGERAGCPSPELLAAYADGRRLWGRRRQLETHFADCDRCQSLLVEVAAFRAADPKLQPQPLGLVTAESPSARTAPSRDTGLLGLLRHPPRLLWAGSGALALAAAVIVAVVVHEPAQPGLDMLIAAVGDQRVTEARLVGFPHGRRPDVLRSTEPGGPMPRLSLEAQAAVTEIQETGASAQTPQAIHALGLSRLIAGDLDPAIEILERASNVDPQNARFLSDLAAAYLTRGTHRNSRQDFEEALTAASQAVDHDRLLLDARFNRALALDKLDQRDRAREAWNEYLKLDSSSAWADEARQRMKP